MICRRLRLAYFPAPKVANTSLKHYFHEAEFGSKFETKTDETTGEKLHIHRVYPTPYWSEDFVELTRDYLRICLIRDPMERVVSAYRNRVLHYGELGPGKVNLELLEERGLNANPTLDEFIKNLEAYRSVKKSIKKHTDPLVSFLGKDPSFYHLILDMKEISRVGALRLALTGEKATIRRMQKDGPPMGVEVLNSEQRELIRSFYADDYRSYKTLESPVARI